MDYIALGLRRRLRALIVYDKTGSGRRFFRFGGG
jgi:hypothetical protein